MRSSHDTHWLEGNMANTAFGRAGLRAVGLVAALAVITGCTAGADPSSASSDLVQDDGGLPLIEDTISAGAWWLAPPGCEGQLGGGNGDVSIAIASLEHGLVAALDESGEIICVDTVEAVQAELEQIGRHDDAEELTVRFEASEMAAQAAMGRPYTGDPHPEPNDCLACGDPHPEPN